ncbi:capsule biosynthesis protein [Paracoccus benzoatiresistens]|uniref:Capsule biosynthesis protein CapA n=1 Tax=Paracoccus benzoatiresistens TaxID=2997341 RepID=A0ABT4J597_9RHOB|nr:capsule biosynthesis protein CapA [Paracoccus sp. EF6]
MLQGPHGPFFDRLGRLLRAAGAQVWRCAFNAGDEFFWSDKDHLLRHGGSSAEWPAHLARIIAERGVTDIVLYGDVRPVHAAARAAAQALNLRLHVFEEGYLRPYWISYERGGSNGHSALLDISLSEMRATLRDPASEVRRPPAHWGDMRQHKFYGAFYHFLVLVANRRYRKFASHRALSVRDEFRLNLRRLVLTPFHSLTRAIQWRRFRLSGDPYLLVPMQLEHDSNLQGHSPFALNREFVEEVVAEFARSAPRHHHLLFKAHPLEDGRARNRRSIREAAARHGIPDRVHYFRGGKLADMLAHARAVITVNSTAAQQALWRGLPVKALGRAVYCKTGLVSGQSLAEFLKDPSAPDMGSYRVFRDYLLQTSQVPGGFYSRRSRAHALRLVADLILAPDDPYRALAAGRFQRRQQIGEVLD